MNVEFKLVPPILIFVRPQSEGNLGALSRVMSNFYSRELRLVGESVVYSFKENDPFSKMDWALCKKGKPILEESKWFESLEAALHDCHFVAGTSGRDENFELGYARPLINPRDLWPQIAQAQSKFGSSSNEAFRWALVLGPEDDGLRADEAALCQSLMRIPTSEMNSSLNAAMAAGVLLYDIAQFSYQAKDLQGPFAETPELKTSEAGRTDWATHAQLEKFLNYLMQLLSLTKLLKYPDDEAVKARIRRWLQMGPIPLGELLFAFEILYHLKSWGSGKFESRDFLKK